MRCAMIEVAIFYDKILEDRFWIYIYCKKVTYYGLRILIVVEFMFSSKFDLTLKKGPKNTPKFDFMILGEVGN